ncbi:MAG: hypothetical protein EBZ67_16405, partial [Chitinophagia bacterium]|nr:hypothetical protein [Chitinophagia bacterium]
MPIRLTLTALILSCAIPSPGANLVPEEIEGRAKLVMQIAREKNDREFVRAVEAAAARLKPAV